MHFGALWPDTHGDDGRPKAMSGEYWTDRYTKGSVSLHERVDKIDSWFEDASREFDY